MVSTIGVDYSSVMSIEFNSPDVIGRRLQAAQTTVYYAVKTESATETYDTLTTTLTDAINAGTFTTTMRSAAGSNPLASATALSEANGGSINAQNSLLEREASEKLTGVQIAGLVIGIVLFVILLTVLVLFANQVKQSQAEYVATSTKSVDYYKASDSAKSVQLTKPVDSSTKSAGSIKSAAEAKEQV